nr:hypothetical protein [uncultured Flavobacterium sp.]
MKNIKSSVFALFGAAILSVSLFSCSNDDTATTNTTTEQTTMAGKAFSDMKIIPSFPNFGGAYDVRLNCIPVDRGICIDLILPGPGTHPSDGIGRIDHFTIRLSMSMETYQANQEYFTEGTFIIDNDFLLAPEVLNELGFSSETVIAKQTAKVIQADDETFYMDLNVKQN